MAIAVNRQDAISCLRIAVFRPSYAPGVDKINTLNSSVIGDVGMTDGRPPHPLTARRSGVCSARGPTARQAALLCLQRPDRLDTEETTYLARFRAQDDQLESACQLGCDFARMVRERQGERLDSWITKATASSIDEVTRFAAGLLADEAAVRAGLTLEWSQGQVEGHVNRVKVLKRQMYGRANFDLLRMRVLHAA
jgi:hypothetical protein